MKRRTFLKQLGLVTALPAFAGGIQTGRGATRKPESRILKILTCNVRVDAPADSKTGDGWASRKEFCASVIRAQGADLIGLQEAQLAHLTDLKAALPQYDSYALSLPEPVFHPANAILYSRERFEVISAGGFWLSEKPHVAGSRSWDTSHSRFVNWTHLKERRSGKELRFWNTHLDHVGQTAREKGAALIVEASEVLSKDLPQLLTGDLNAGVANQAVQNLLEGGWTDTYAAVHGPTDPGFTAHGFKGTQAAETRPDGSPRPKIDWILCRGPIEPLSAAILRDSRDGHYPSDHFFVSAEAKF